MNEDKITKKRIAELEGIVDKLKEEEANLKARLGEAEANLWNAQREVRRNAKPSPAMLATLALIATGELIHRDRFYSGGFHTRDSNGRRVKVRDSVFFGLAQRETITKIERQEEWRINEHGRAVLDRWTQKEKAA